MKSIDKVETNSIKSKDYHHLEEMDIQLIEKLMKGKISEIKGVVLNLLKLKSLLTKLKTYFLKY